MKSRATPRFWAAYRELRLRSGKPRERRIGSSSRTPATQAFQLKKVHHRDPIYSARATLGYRALGLLDDDEIAWFWIGTHAAYDRLLEDL